MAATMGVGRIRRLVAQRLGMDLEDVEKVLEAYETVMRGLIATGAKVRILDGWFILLQKEATRRRHPKTKELRDVPAKEVIVYRVPKPRGESD